MESFQWTTDEFVFVPQLDADHQKLFQDTEVIRAAVERGMPTNQMAFHVWRLMKSFAMHLGSEERLMRGSRYPAQEWHQKQHRAGRGKMAKLLEASRRTDDGGFGAALEEFARWMRDHVNLADRMLAAHLRNDRRERLAS
jgi:hemerythrin-like metal-binding protein